jgi:O-methyltransferase
MKRETKIEAVRKIKSLFMKWNMHGVVRPFQSPLHNAVNMASLSEWRKQHPVKGYNDFYLDKCDFSLRYKIYEVTCQQEQLFDVPVDYFEFGVAGGMSFKWWLQHNKHQGSRFFGFDTFEGLPEDWGGFAKGEMKHTLDSIKINDERASFHKGLFQETLLPFLNTYEPRNRKVIHMDADLFSSTIFPLSQLHRFIKPGDIILFDEFAVPMHEFLAFKIYTESFYVDYDVIAAANNYLFVAVKITGIKR